MIKIVNKFKSEIFFITDKFIIFRLYNEKGNKFKIRHVKTNFEHLISNEKVNEIVYGKKVLK